MRNLSFFAAGLFVLALAFSCKNNKTPTPLEAVVVGSNHYEKTGGKDCDKPDTLRTNCASIDLSWPNVETGTSALKKSVSAWANGYLVGILAPETDVKAAAKASIEAKASEFMKAQKEFSKEAPGSPLANFTAESKHDVLLNNNQHLTLEIEGYTFMGGAHGSPTAAVASFDVRTGKQLNWDDLVTDKKAFQDLAEKTFKAERPDLFQPTDGSEPFSFDENFPFALPQQFGLVQEGIYCHYLAYEVGPYSIGNTKLVVPFEALGALSKIKPTAPAPGSASEVSDIYETVGDSVVIPTFEIEVSNSAKAAKTLRGKKESIVVSAYLAGFPSDKKDLDEDGSMAILDKKIELLGDQRVARFAGLKFSKKTYDKLAKDDKDISLLINVYSGRKSTSDNLLDCGILEMKASKFANKRFVLGCRLIDEPIKSGATASSDPLACYALPADGSAPTSPLPLSVSCDESGNIDWAGQPMKDYDALMNALRPLLKDMLKNGAKELPELETSGCMMGNSGEMHTRFDELKAEIMGKGKPATAPTASEEPVEKIAPKKGSTAAPAPKAGSGAKPSATDKKAPAKAAPAKASGPAITINEKAEITLSGKKIALESLRKTLQNELLALAVIPDEIEAKSIGTVGMGARAELRSEINEAIKGAKWVRKKAAIAALNTSVGKKLATSSQLELATYKTSGSFAYISAKPKQADGKAIDYSKTAYAKDAKAGAFADNAIGLLKFENGNWKLLAFSIGVKKPPVDAWVKNYKAPKSLF